MELEFGEGKVREKKDYDDVLGSGNIEIG